mgnify:CR=1 FL=1
MHALPAARVSIFYCQGMVLVGEGSVFFIFQKSKVEWCVNSFASWVSAVQSTEL